MGIKIVVTGGKRFRDQKLLYRALDAVHKKHHIDTLVVGARAGAEEIAYQWGVVRTVREIVTFSGYALDGHQSYIDRNRDMLQYYAPSAVVVFPAIHEGVAKHMAEFARSMGYKVWEVPADWS